MVSFAFDFTLWNQCFLFLFFFVCFHLANNWITSNWPSIEASIKEDKEETVCLLSETQKELWVDAPIAFKWRMHKKWRELDNSNIITVFISDSNIITVFIRDSNIVVTSIGDSNIVSVFIRKSNIVKVFSSVIVIL